MFEFSSRNDTQNDFSAKAKQMFQALRLKTGIKIE